MFSKSSMSLLAAVALVGCGGPMENEEQGKTPTPETAAPATEGAAQPGGEEGGTVTAQASTIVAPGARGEVPSWWPGSTHVQLQGYGSNFTGTSVHMWCTTGAPENDITFWIYPNHYPQYEWWCYGRTIYVRNQGTDGLTQTIQVTSW